MHRLLALVSILTTLAPAQAPTPAMQRVLAMPVADAPDQGIPMTVHDGEIGGTIPGAIAITLPPDWERCLYLPTGGRTQLPPLRERILEIAADVGTRYRADPQGVVTVPEREIGSRGWLVAIDGDRVAIDRVVKDSPVVVTKSRMARVLVRDSRGRPAKGVPLALTTGCLASSPLAITDASGVAQVDVALALGHFSWGGTICALIPARAAVSAEIRDFRGETPTAEIALPPCGRVRFLLYGPDEKPWSAIRTVRLRFIDEPKPIQNFPAGFGVQAVESHRDRGVFVPPAQLEKDNATFWHVPVGKSLEAEVSIDGIAGTVLFLGKAPTRAGEFVILDGRVNATIPLIVMRVEGADGQALVRQEVRIVLYDDAEDSKALQQWMVRTDDQGYVRFSALGDDVARAVVERREKPAGGKEAISSVSVPLTELEPGLQDLGVRRLKRPE